MDVERGSDGDRQIVGGHPEIRRRPSQNGQNGAGNAKGMKNDFNCWHTRTRNCFVRKVFVLLPPQNICGKEILLCIYVIIDQLLLVSPQYLKSSKITSHNFINRHLKQCCCCHERTKKKTSYNEILSFLLSCYFTNYFVKYKSTSQSIDYERRAVFESIAKQFSYNYHGLKAEQSNIPSALDRPPGVEKAFSLNKTLKILSPSSV